MDTGRRRDAGARAYWMKRHCPDCQTPVPLRARIRQEFLGGHIACGCGARLHIKHDAAWILGSVLGTAVLSDLAVFLVVLFTLAFTVAWLGGWWSLAVGTALFVTLGVLVAALSPLKVVASKR